MENRRRKISFDESVKNAAAGYAVVVLAIACFVLSLAVLSAIVRIVVGASAGA
ncbi:MAG: hypothetical protein IJI68_12720 [Eggerthellaceae bacterium]|jgi:hypothetical protein|nr:hypothetical protein [Eggerthellaceae bacterium]